MMQASDIPKANRMLQTLAALNRAGVSWEGVHGRYPTGDPANLTLLDLPSFPAYLREAQQEIIVLLKKMGVEVDET